MTRMTPRVVPTLLVASALATALATSPRLSRAQASVSADVAFNSQYVWRGVTSTNRPVVQPDVSISAPMHGLTITAGAWGNIEPMHYDGPRDLSSLNGLPGPIVTQSEAWAELAGTIAKRVDASFGAEGYFYPHVGDLADYNTVELYATAAVHGLLSPSLAINYDVARIRGAYLEAGVSQEVSGERHGALTLALAAGFSAGQAADPTGRDLAYFARDGFTHLDGSATASFTLGPVAFAPEAHVIYAHDTFATVVAPDATRRVKVWFGTTLRWSNEHAAR